jgi:hypothetical protein
VKWSRKQIPGREHHSSDLKNKGFSNQFRNEDFRLKANPTLRDHSKDGEGASTPGPQEVSSACPKNKLDLQDSDE